MRVYIVIGLLALFTGCIVLTSYVAIKKNVDVTATLLEEDDVEQELPIFKDLFSFQWDVFSKIGPSETMQVALFATPKETYEDVCLFSIEVPPDEGA